MLQLCIENKPTWYWPATSYLMLILGIIRYFKNDIIAVIHEIISIRIIPYRNLFAAVVKTTPSDLVSPPIEKLCCNFLQVKLTFGVRSTRAL